MLRSELFEIIANGENSGVEFKRDDIRPEQLGKEIVALANLRGGMILLGVEDDGSINGITRPNCEEWVMDTVFGHKVHPTIIPFYEEVALEDGKRVAMVSFPQGISKPYILRHNGREEIYIRIGSTSQLATREQQARLYSIGGLLHTEVMPVPGTNLGCLDLPRLANYLADFLMDPDVPSPTDTEGWTRRLLGLGFMEEAQSGSPMCSIAGLVLFGKAPRRFLRQAGIRLMVFDSLDKTYEAKLDEILEGPLVGRFESGRESAQRIVDEGIIEKLSSRISAYIRRGSGTVDGGMRRPTEELYPWEAVREAVINAMVHRDWTRFTDMEIVLYSDRMEITSPGALQNSMTIEKMVAGQRSPRNPLIVDVMRDYGYVDARGMGIRTKMIPLMRASSGMEPDFISSEDYLKVILHRKLDN